MFKGLLISLLLVVPTKWLIAADYNLAATCYSCSTEDVSKAFNSLRAIDGQDQIILFIDLAKKRFVTYQRDVVLDPNSHTLKSYSIKKIDTPVQYQVSAQRLIM